MSEQLSFSDLMDRLRGGDDEATRAVFNRFAARLIQVARNRLDPLVRQKLDPEDIIQSVFRSFFGREADPGTGPSSWDSLWGLLTVITLRKCGRWTDYFQAARRDVHREISFRGAHDTALPWEALGREPLPEDAVILTELVEQLMRGLESHERLMVQLSLQGYTIEEISVQVGYTRRTVQRLLKRVREDLERQNAERSSPDSN